MRDPTVVEEEERIIAQALRFDELVRLPAWNEVLEHAIARVNEEIIEATRPPDSGEYFIDWPERQRIRVLRWDSKREIVDAIRSFVDATRSERDRILKEREEELEYAGNR